MPSRSGIRSAVQVMGLGIGGLIRVDPAMAAAPLRRIEQTGAWESLVVGGGLGGSNVTEMPRLPPQSERGLGGE